MGAFVLLLVIIGAVAIIAIGMYNSLVTLRNRCDNGWSQIDVQLRRRYDLIPNLVETVKGYAKHEREVFEKVTQARAAAVDAQTVKEHGQADNMLTGALKSLFAVAENYPELTANQNFLMLQEELAATEPGGGSARFAPRNRLEVRSRRWRQQERLVGAAKTPYGDRRAPLDAPESRSQPVVNATGSEGEYGTSRNARTRGLPAPASPEKRAGDATSTIRQACGSSSIPVRFAIRH